AHTGIREEAKPAEMLAVAQVQAAVEEVPVVAYAEQSPVVEQVGRQAAGAGGSVPMHGAGGVTDTEMLAELYISQGHSEKGLEVYRRLAAREPDNLRLHEKIQRLEEGGVGISHAPAKGYPENAEEPKRPKRGDV